MESNSLRLVIVADQRIPRVRAAWQEFESLLAEVNSHRPHDLEVVAIDRECALDFSTVDADLVLVLGGDGAILRACRQMGPNQIPVMGINHGRLGFLADLPQEEFRNQLPAILAKSYQIVQYLMYRCRLTPADNSVPQEFLGLNEVVISAGGALRMIDVELVINGEPVTTYSADGLIISTPVGSTAHSLSAGGPIVRQDLPAFLITPICPHTLTDRPLVDSANSTYRLTVPRAIEGTTLVIDGQERIPIAPGDVIEVTRAPCCFQMAKLPGSSYYTTLHRKLGWAGRPNYRVQQ